MTFDEFFEDFKNRTLMSDYKILDEENKRLHDLHYKRTKLTTEVIAARDELKRQNKALMEFVEEVSAVKYKNGVIISLKAQASELLKRLNDE